MPEKCTQRLTDAEKTHACGASLAHTVYNRAIDILVSGELGAGKTTFLQGVGAGLGVDIDMTSPTYALEQRYHTARHGELIHIDLYRLTAAQAKALLLQTEDHPGIRAIEWPLRVSDDAFTRPLIRVDVSDEGTGRRLDCSFEDMPLPTRAEIDAWRDDVLLPAHIRAHCDVVAGLAVELGRKLLERGVLVRLAALERAGELHDLLRFLDFRPNAHPPGTEATAAQERMWASMKSLYPGMKHEQACATLLRAQGFPELADIVEPHGLSLPAPARQTIEQKLLYYADKRVVMDRVVTLEERFADFAERYGDGKVTPQQRVWLQEVQDVEYALFPEGVPKV